MGAIIFPIKVHTHVQKDTDLCAAELFHFLEHSWFPFKMKSSLYLVVGLLFFVAVTVCFWFCFCFLVCCVCLCVCLFVVIVLFCCVFGESTIAESQARLEF